MSDQGRSVVDRALRLVRPVPDRSFVPPPRGVATGLCVVDRKLRMPPFLTLPTRMTVVRLPSRGLLLHSPVKLDAKLLKALGALGKVEAILAPNSFHYLFASEYLDIFPDASFFVAPDLPQRIASLPRGTVLGSAPPPTWEGVLDQLIFGPVKQFTEVVFLHKPTRTLVLTDLAFNMSRVEGAYNRLVWRLMGVPPHFGPSRSARLTLLGDAARARSFLSRILDWDFDRIIVGHGDVVDGDAKTQFQRGFGRYLS